MGERATPYFPEWRGSLREQAVDEIPKALFEGGEISVSTEALMALGLAGEDFRALLEMHLLGDFGDVDEVTRVLNNQAVEQGEYVLSAYRLPTGVEIEIGTTGDRQQTVIDVAQGLP